MADDFAFTLVIASSAIARVPHRSAYIDSHFPEHRMSRNQTVVVTGASAGVGRAVSLAFAGAGWNVGLIARGSEGLEGAHTEIEKLGVRAHTAMADVSDPAKLAQAAADIEQALGPVDVWVNNAMVTVYGRSVDVTPEEWEQVTRVSYLGQVYGTLAALKLMRSRNRGTIVCIGSALAYRSIPFQAPYCAAKSAVRAFVDSLRCELMNEHSAIRLTMVHLPAVNTPQFDWARNKLGKLLAPVPPIFQPETVGAAVLRAAKRAPREYWLGSSTVTAIVAQMIAPSVADRYLAREGVANETAPGLYTPGHPDNLFDAGLGDPGAHGRFDKRASAKAFSFNPAMLRAVTALGLAGLVLRLLTARARA